MPLVTYADLQAPAVSDPSMKVYQLVETRIHDDAKPMPQPPNPRLSAAQTMTLDTWIAAGAPAASGGACPTSDAGSDGSADAATLGCTPDVMLRPGSPWTMPADETDVYVCYGVDVPVTGQRQIIGFEPHIDNTKIVHHTLVYESATATSPTPTPCAGGGVTQNALLYGWAPGGVPFELPPQAGYPMTTGTQHFIVQVHYSNLTGLSNEMDSTGFDLCTTSELRPNDAAVVAFGSESFTIPAHGSLDITCDLPLPTKQPMNVISAFPHMHLLGTAIETTATPAGVDAGDGGSDLQLGGVAEWDFNSEIWFPLSVTVDPGATIHTRCAWDNTTAAPVSFGQDTSDEMCYSFTMYYPADTAIKSWTLPALASTCHPTM